MSGDSVFILGGGFIGGPLAHQLKALNYDVQVSTRSEKNTLNFESSKIQTFCFSVGDEFNLLDSAHPDVLILSYPIGAKNNPTIDSVAQVKWISKYFSSAKIRQVILTSSTSVYPDGYGVMNEENRETPDGSGLVQLQYENALRSIYGNKLTIFRLAGLVGQERLPGRFLANKKDIPNPHSPVNLVHQKDVLRFVIAAIERKIKNEVFNLCHNKHPERALFYRDEALKMNLTPPMFSENQIENPKWVDNQKSKSFFNLDYEFPISM